MSERLFAQECSAADFRAQILEAPVEMVGQRPTERLDIDGLVLAVVSHLLEQLAESRE